MTRIKILIDKVRYPKKLFFAMFILTVLIYIASSLTGAKLGGNNQGNTFYETLKNLIFECDIIKIAIFSYLGGLLFSKDKRIMQEFEE